MAHDVVEVEALSGEDVHGRDFSFDVDSRVIPPFDPSLESEIRTESLDEPYRKRYDVDFDDLTSPDEDDGKKQFLAVVKTNDGVRGYIFVREWWNKMASLEDIAIDRSYRGKGASKALIQRALDWTSRMELVALRAETQDNNVAACRLYRGCGFAFGGYDAFLYAADEKLRHEKAIFWCLFVRPDGQLQWLLLESATC